LEIVLLAELVKLVYGPRPSQGSERSCFFVYYFSIALWNWSNSMVFFVFRLSSTNHLSM